MYQSCLFREWVYCSTYDSACYPEFSSVLAWTVENTAKTVVRTGMDRCIFDDTESEYFWEKKRFSVDGALENGRPGWDYHWIKKKSMAFC